ncbi:MAG: hypothetical protein A2169_14020, partial [Deltaproteobacteria bacterium RBG_13_47_9]
PEILHGALYDTTIYSNVLGNSRTIRVYTPPMYNPDGPDSFEVAVFHDGLDWINFSHANNALDYLIFNSHIRPLIAIFVPPVNRDAEYIGDQQDPFAEFLTTELLPYIDAKYKTQKRPESRANIGISNGGNIALWILHKYPQEFGNAASFSGNIQSTTSSAFENGSLQSPRLYIDAGTYDLSGFLVLTRNFRQILQAKSYAHSYNEWHEGHSWGSWGAHLDNALEFFFPGNPVGLPEEQELPGSFVLMQMSRAT